LAKEHISFGRAGLPNWKLTAIDAVPTGSSTKVGIQFETGTLKSLGLAQSCLPGSDQLVIVERSDRSNGSWHLATGDGDLCTVYIGGAFSRELALAGKSAQAAWAKDDCAKLLGSDALNAVVAVEATPFDTMETLGGGYSYLRVGYPDARNALEKPIEDRLFFAGEACGGVDATTAHGAWSSGVGAVDRIHLLQS
jgi:monoamine oxidase